MYQKNMNDFGSTYNQLTNASVEYKKENNPWAFGVSSKNLLDNGKQSVYSISDYMISEQTTYVLSRVIMLSVSYKL